MNLCCFHVLQYLTFFNLIEHVFNNNLKVIKHTLVGNDIIIHCDQVTLRADGKVNPVRWEFSLLRSGQSAEVLFDGNPPAETQKIDPHRHRLVSFKKYDGKFDFDLLIRDVKEHDAGEYTCKISDGIKNKDYTEMIVRLFVHKREDDNACQDNWLYWAQHKVCLRVIYDYMSRSESVEFCKYHHNASLVKVRSQSMDLFVGSVADQDAAYWIGLLQTKTGYLWWDKTQLGFADWADKYPKKGKNKICVAKEADYNGSWVNLECDTDNRAICERSIVWRNPPLWQVVIAGVIMMVVLTSLACCFIGVWPNRSTLARTLGFLGRTDVVSEMMTASTVIVIYDSELNDLLK